MQNERRILEYARAGSRHPSELARVSLLWSVLSVLAMGLLLTPTAELALAAPLLALAGIATAIAALSSRSERRKAVAWAGLLIGLANLAFMARVLVIAVKAANVNHQLIHRASELRQVGQALLLYAEDHGRLPPDFVPLMEDYDLPASLLTGDQGAQEPPTTQAVLADLADAQRTRFHFLAASLPKSQLRPELVLAHSRRGDDQDGRILVLYADGTVSHLGPAEAEHLLAELAAGRNPPRPFGADAGE